ncbi:hypothetical protein LVJ94_38185 [Pendulispora rubella]|uniref:Uncharacterized protein n=1 Tax=Pendulispora rubella TaxID=2741070 RepID=A0ABZ2KZJ6_9BACT
MRSSILLCSVLFASAGCSLAPDESVPSDERAGAVRQPDRISPADDPTGLFPPVAGLPSFSPLLNDNISNADVGKTFGTDDRHVPYPDTYWPYSENGIDVRWQGSDTQSPLEKLITVTNPQYMDAAKEWNWRNHGQGAHGGQIQSWEGICNGWTAAATANAPLKHAVFAKRGAGGGIAACAEGTPDCVKFEIGDVNALMAEAYYDARSRLIGSRCDTMNVERDEYGRIVRKVTSSGASVGCQGLNAGAFLIVLHRQLKEQRKPFVLDVQHPNTTAQIWNQPAFRYTINRYEALNEAEAANLVATGRRTGAFTRYQWDDQAKGFVFVDASVFWVAESGPNVAPVSGLQSMQELRVVAVIELDRPATDNRAKIIGGEYLDDPSVGANRLEVAPFAWLVTDTLPDNVVDPVGPRNHYVDPSVVKKLVAMGQR